MMEIAWSFVGHGCRMRVDEGDATGVRRVKCWLGARHGEGNSFSDHLQSLVFRYERQKLRNRNSRNKV
jgi:hypothetical protein